ncbi:SCAN domain-containing protein 3-like [Leptopilina boulardi]|uniref:SCAN domain-containing protein 3-like n=1 Tax=Leptopilina boulardi TaxID=63433 RepID=UPI0021F56658|nr:SCAN domain-containing protein 3-like [Leptopilina boulardi]
MVHGKPRHSQSQGSVERYNQDVRDMLVSWMADNKTKKWSEGLRFIQSKKNRALHTGIKVSPYEAMFGCSQKIGLGDSQLLEEDYASMTTEEELEELLSAPNTEDQSADNSTEDNTNDCEKDVIDNKCHICGIEADVEDLCITTDENELNGKKLCKVCFRKIVNTRGAAARGLKRQAEKMLAHSNEKLRPVPVGSNVVLGVPDVDRSRVAARNVLAVVEAVTPDGLHRLGTKDGTLHRQYARNEFTPADSRFITAQDVPPTTLTLRKASALNSGSTQGFVFCNCAQYCKTNKCKCRTKNVDCNSKCHSNSSCKTKFSD